MATFDLLRKLDFIPEEVLLQNPRALGSYLFDHPHVVDLVVPALLPDSTMIAEFSEPQIREFYNNSLEWILDIIQTQKEFVALAEGNSGVCGAIWSSNEVAYRCKTCELDPTCAICVNCFLDGNHEGHDFSMIRTTGGCCDCGDPTAWKEQGFCRYHKGPGLVPPLPDHVDAHMKRILQALLKEWKIRIARVENHNVHNFMDILLSWNSMDNYQKDAHVASCSFSDFLVKFCVKSESLMNIVAYLMTNSELNMLECLYCSPWLPITSAAEAIKSLNFRLLGNPDFKVFFSIFFVNNYQSFTCSNSVRQKFYVTVMEFSVQILTVSTLTTYLVKSHQFGSVLIKTLTSLFRSSLDSEGKFNISKDNLRSISSRVVSDLNFILNHNAVSKYITHVKSKITFSFFKILAFLQEMSVQTRRTDTHIEIEMEDWKVILTLDMLLAELFPLLVNGSVLTEPHDSSKFPSLPSQGVDNHEVDKRNEKLKEKLDEVSVLGRKRNIMDEMNADDLHENLDESIMWKGVKFPSSLIQLTHMCCHVLAAWITLNSAISKKRMNADNKFVSCFWLSPLLDDADTDDSSSEATVPTPPLKKDRMNTEFPPSIGSSTSTNARTTGLHNSGEPRKRLLKTMGMAVRRWFSDALMSDGNDNDSEDDNMKFDDYSNDAEESATDKDEAGIFSEKNISFFDYLSKRKLGENEGNEWLIDLESILFKTKAPTVCENESWPSIQYDVASKPVSFHYPLHRMFALFLHRNVQMYADGKNQIHLHSEKWMESDELGAFSSSEFNPSFLLHLLPPMYRTSGFIGNLMEHPLRLQVLCAQIHVGLWKRNGYSMLVLNDYYHSAVWCEKTLDLDFFLLQYCAVTSPSADFLQRVVERFDLEAFFSLEFHPYSEYEPHLAKQAIEFLIQIITERGLNGLSPNQILRRELIHRLAVSDATHSTLIKSLPPYLSDRRDIVPTLSSISIYSKPRGVHQGKYSLKKECWKELDMHHLRWSANELQKVEDKYLDELKECAMTQQLPKWTNPYPGFEGLKLIATSERVHNLLLSIFLRFAHNDFDPNPQANSIPLTESLLHSSLHLLALVIDICKHEKNVSRAQNRKDLSAGVSANRDSQESHPNRTQSISFLELARNPVQFGQHSNITIKQASLISVLLFLMKRYGGHSKFSAAKNALVLNLSNASINVIDKADSIINPNLEMNRLIHKLMTQLAEIDEDSKAAIEGIAPDIFGKGKQLDLGEDAEGKRGKEEETEEERRKATAKARQAEILARMKAAQEMFAALNEPSTEDFEEQTEKKIETDVVSEKGKWPIKEVKEDGKGKTKFEVQKNMREDHEHEDIVCVLCKEASTTDLSPMCYISFQQRSRLLAIASHFPYKWDSVLSIPRPLSPRLVVSQAESRSGQRLPTSELNADLLEWVQETLQTGINDQLAQGSEELVIDNDQLMTILAPRLPQGLILTITHVENVPNQGTRFVLNVSMGTNDPETGSRGSNESIYEEQEDNEDEDEDDDEVDSDEEESDEFVVEMEENMEDGLDEDEDSGEDENDQDMDNIVIMNAEAWLHMENAGRGREMGSNDNENNENGNFMPDVEFGAQELNRLIDVNESRVNGLMEAERRENDNLLTHEGQLTDQQDTRHNPLPYQQSTLFNSHDNEDNNHNRESTETTKLDSITQNSTSSFSSLSSSQIPEKTTDNSQSQSLSNDEMKNLTHVLYQYSLHQSLSQSSIDNRTHSDPFQIIELERLPKILSLNQSNGLNVSGCGHAIHQECFTRYFQMFSKRQRLGMYAAFMINTQLGDFVCPMCRRLGNSLLPMYKISKSNIGSKIHLYVKSSSFVDQLKLSETMKVLSVSNQMSLPSREFKLDLMESMSYLQNIKNLLVKKTHESISLPFLPNVFTPAKNFSSSLCKNVHQGFNAKDVSDCMAKHLTEIHVWESFFYTIASAELAMRGGGVHLPHSTIETIQSSSMTSISSMFLPSSAIRVSALQAAVDESRGSLLPSLHQTAISMSDNNLKSILISTRSMQLLFWSLVRNESQDKISLFSDANQERHVIEEFMKKNKDIDMRLWKMCANPAISQDPFFVLCWLVFCHVSVPLHEDNFKKLVHLCYLLCIAQGFHCIMSQIPEERKNIESVANFKPFFDQIKNSCPLIPFSSSPLSPHQLNSCDPLVLLRLLTLPFLRRTAILSHLLFKNINAFSFPLDHDIFTASDCLKCDIVSNHYTQPDSVFGQQSPTPTFYTSNCNAQILSGNNIILTISPSSQKSSSASSSGTSSATIKCENHERLQAEDREFQKVERSELEIWEWEFNIPSISSIFEDESCKRKMLDWYKHLSEEVSSRELNDIIPPSLASPFRLISLPNLFHDLFQRYILRKCERCNHVPLQPSLCLLCGAFRCGIARSDESKSRKGKCADFQKHAFSCCMGIGAFLMIRDTSIYVVRGERSMPWIPVYLDAYGEEDLNLKRGNALFLNNSRYSALASLVASYRLFDSNLPSNTFN